ncbi:hypothetical protein PQ786_07770 [Alcaligenes faecalis]
MEARKKTRATICISSIVLMCTITLFLLGYSSALAIESVFGIPAKLTYSSTIELLHLSSLVFSGWLETINSQVFHEKIKELTITASVIGAAISATIFAIKKTYKKTKENKKHQEKIERNSFLTKTIHWIYKEKLNFIPMAIGATLPVVTASIMAATIALFITIPAIGLPAAEQHLQSWLIESDYCTPLINRENRIPKKQDKNQNKNQKKTTPCLSIWKNGKYVAEGRYIASIGTHIAIFNPENGEVLIEPIDGASIKVSGEEELNQKENKKISE